MGGIFLTFRLTKGRDGDIFKKTVAGRYYFALGVSAYPAWKRGVYGLAHVTIEDVAAAAGVSTTTVFKALNGRGKVSEETRRRIQQLAADMQYVPNRYAQSLARREIRIACVSCGDTPADYQAYIDQGLEETFADYRGTNVVGCYYRYSMEQGYAEAAAILEDIAACRNIDAVVLQSSYTDSLHCAKLQKLADRGIPVLSLGSRMEGTPVSGYVMTDGRMMGRMAAELLALRLGGYGRVAVLTPDPSVEIHLDCLDGFLETASAYSLEMTGTTVTGYTEPQVRAAVEQLLREVPSLAGIYVTSSNAAMTCRYLKEHGISSMCVVGQDIHPAVAGCLKDHSLLGTLFQNQRLQAQKAVEKILEKLQNPDRPVTSELVIPQLVLRSNLDGYTY